MAIKYPDYKNSIMNVSNTFLQHYGIETKHDGIKELHQELKSNPDHIIFILLDGLGTNIINKHLKDSDGLKKNMIKEITSVFPPTTVAATNSVLSGQPPITTGYLGWVQYFEQEDSNVTVFLNNDFYDARVKFDYVVREKFLSYKSIITQINEAREDVEAGVIVPKLIGGTSNSFKDAVEQVLISTHNKDKSFTYLYWTDPDLTEHKYGINSPETLAVLQDLNSDYEDLIANIPENTMVVLIADHGLTNVEEVFIKKYELLMSYLKRKPSIEPRAINFFVKDGKLEEFKIEFNKHFEDSYMLLTTQELLDSKLLGDGDKHELIDMFLGDYIGIATSNILFSLNGKKSYKAHHAGLLEDEMMVPLIVFQK